MEKNRDDFLNDLIKYYDGDKTPSPADNDMGATRVISAPKAAPREETMGNTVVVNVKKNPAPASPAPESEEPAAETEDDVKVYTPASDPEPKPEPVDEVLGNLNFEGMPNFNTEPPAPREEPVIPLPAEKPKKAPSYAPDPIKEDAMRKRKGIWYALKPLWVTVILCIVAAAGFKFYVTTDGVIGTYKRNFNYNMGLIFNMLGLEWDSSGYSLPVIGMGTSKAAILSENTPIEINVGSDEYTEEDNIREEEESAYYSALDSYILPFDEAGNSEISVMDDGVVCAKSNYLCFIDTAGKTVWETDTAISGPLLSTCGKYIAIASDGGTQVSLYKKNKLIYTVEAPNSIRSCSVSARGDVVLVTDRPSYKGAVVLLNSKGETVFSWSSGVNYITAANVLKNRRIVVSLVSAEPRITSYVMLFNIKSTDPLAGAELQESLIYALDTNGKLTYVNGDNCVSCISPSGSVRYDMRFSAVSITHSANDVKGNRLITYTQENMPVMNLYNKHGALEYSAAIEGVPDYIDVYKNTVLYNHGRDIISGKTDDEKKVKYTASRTIKALKLINTSTYAAVYSDGIDIVKF